VSSDLSKNGDNTLDPCLDFSDEAARLRRVSRQAIADLMKKNRFRTLKIGGKTY